MDSLRAVKLGFLNTSIALQLPECVVAFLVWTACVPKPELRHWKVGLVSEETAVFTPHLVILVTVAGTTWVCTRVIHTARAFVAARSGPTPVRHILTIT